MKKAFLAGSVLVASLLVGNISSVAADDEIPSPKPVEIMRARHDVSITSGASMVWDLDAPAAVPAIVAMTEPIGTPPQPEPRALCTSADEAACSPSTYPMLSVSSVLGPCQSDSEVGCIESLTSKNADGQFAPLTLIAGGETVHAENAALSLPRSATLSTWQDTTGARYVLTAHMSSSLRASSGAWSPPTASTLTVLINRISRTATHPAGWVSIIDSPSQPGRKTVSYANGTPFNTVEMASGVRFNLKVRVPNTVSGWFQGRMANAVVGSRSLTNSRTVYEIEGDVLPVYIAGGEASSTDPNYPMKGSPNTGWINALSSPSQISLYDAWKPYFAGDKAVATRNEWALTALALPTNSCFDAAKGMTGVASSNSAFYSPTPPTYNPTTGAVDYKVASPHFDEKGVVAVGSYSLSVPTAAVQCLYKTDQVPESAELSTTYDDGSTPYTVTKSLTNKDGWINVSVSGLHFSAPTISARFGKPATGGNGFTSFAGSATSAVAAVPRLAKGASKALSSIYRAKASQKPKWTASGACSLSGSKVLAKTKSGTCTVTVRVLNAKKKYVVVAKKVFTVS